MKFKQNMNLGVYDNPTHLKPLLTQALPKIAIKNNCDISALVGENIAMLFLREG